MEASEAYFIRQSEKILSKFKFKRVRLHMKETGWSYYCGDFKREVPSVKRLKSLANDLLYRLATTKDLGYSCGGFQASKNDDVLSLRFTSRGGEIIEQVVYEDSALSKLRRR